MNNVITMPTIPVKTEKFRVNNLHEVKLTFIPYNPEALRWKWELTVHRTEYYSNYAKSIDVARARALRVLDTALGGVKSA